MMHLWASGVRGICWSQWSDAIACVPFAVLWSSDAVRLTIQQIDGRTAGRLYDVDFVR